jgi:hypothetical protein
MSRSLRGVFGFVMIILVAGSGCNSSTNAEPPTSYSKNAEPPQKVGGTLKGSNKQIRGFTVKKK